MFRKLHGVPKLLGHRTTMYYKGQNKSIVPNKSHLIKFGITLLSEIKEPQRKLYKG